MFLGWQRIESCIFQCYFIAVIPHRKYQGFVDNDDDNNNNNNNVKYSRFNIANSAICTINSNYRIAAT
jgi:hypothetical protein